MRLAVISDIHANLAALETVLDDIVERGADATINLGDSVSEPLWPRETMELLEARAPFRPCEAPHDRFLSDHPVGRLGPSDRYALKELGSDACVDGALGSSAELVISASSIDCVHVSGLLTRHDVRWPPGVTC